MLDDRDRRLLAAIDHVGPVSVYALAYHTAADAFDTHDELAARVGALSAEGYLRGRTLTDVTGDPLTEYEPPRGVDPAVSSSGR